MINCDGSIRPGLLCLDFASGEELWFAERPNRIVSYSTPCVWKHDGQTEILMRGSSFLDSYDPSDGASIWQVNNLPGFVCPTPIADENAVYYGAFTTAHVSGGNAIETLFPEGFLASEEISNADAFYERFDHNKDRKIAKEELPPSRLKEAFNYTDSDQSGSLEYEEFAPRFESQESADNSGRNVFVSVAAGGKGDITDTHVTWEKRKNLPYVSSPLLYKNRLYLVKKGGTVSCYNPVTGEAHISALPFGATVRICVLLLQQYRSFSYPFTPGIHNYAAPKQKRLFKNIHSRGFCLRLEPHTQPGAGGRSQKAQCGDFVHR